MKNIIVGVSASHDASACVMIDGKLEIAVQLERITRIKRDGQPYLSSDAAIDYCLDALQLNRSDVTLYAFNSQGLMPEYNGLMQPISSKNMTAFDPRGENSLFVSHHLAHAFSAHFCSPFESSTSLVIDGSGGTTPNGKDFLIKGTALAEYLAQPNGERLLHTESVYRFTPSSFELLDRQYSPSFNTRCGSASPGEMYASIAQYIFGDWQTSGKVMGLAPYGNADAFSSSLLLTKNGLLHFDHTWKQKLNDTDPKADPLLYSNLAARVQLDLEQILLQRAKRAIDISGDRQLVYSGGVALNSVANAKISRLENVQDIFIIPASNDAGIAIGAAAAGHYHLTGSTKGQPYTNDFLGYNYRTSDIEFAINDYKNLLDIQTYIPDQVAKELATGKIIALFEGSSEFGPRALGHRSILGDPRNKSTWTEINRYIKFREDFRPFAPAVIEDLASQYFDIDGPERFMLRVVNVKPEYKELLGAVTHVDGTARVQTVPQSNDKLYHLLHAFKANTGLPILLNTSFNVRGQPIVETPSEAIDVLFATFLDGLVIGDYYITLKQLKDIDGNMKLAVNPQISFSKQIVELEEVTTIDIPSRKKRLTYPPFLYDALLHLSRGIVLNQALKMFDETSRPQLFKLIKSLVVLRVLNVSE